MPPAATQAFLGHASLFGAVAESTFGTTPGAGTIAALTNAFVFKSESVKKTGNIVERDGLRGTRSHVADDTRNGPYTVAGQIVLEPTKVDLAFWLPYIFGQAGSGSGPTTYALSETLISASIGFQRGPRKLRYTGITVDRATFRCSQGAYLELVLDVVGQAEAVETTSWPSISADVGSPFIMHDATFTVAATSREIRDFELTIDNALIKDRFMNNVVVQNLPPGDRQVALRTTHAWATANLDLYDAGITGFTGVTLALNNGVDTLTFTMGKLQAPADTPTAASRGENYLPVAFMSRKTGSTMELAATL